MPSTSSMPTPHQTITNSQKNPPPSSQPPPLHAPKPSSQNSTRPIPHNSRTHQPPPPAQNAAILSRHTHPPISAHLQTTMKLPVMPDRHTSLGSVDHPHSRTHKAGSQNRRDGLLLENHPRRPAVSLHDTRQPIYGNKVSHSRAGGVVVESLLLYLPYPYIRPIYLKKT